MEHQTGFDLTAAVENWRHELNAQPGLTPDERRELESHLQDSITELHQRGLSDQESFWLARRRLGSPQSLATEFATADPAKLWRGRVFWMAMGCLGMFFWNRLANICFSCVPPAAISTEAVSIFYLNMLTYLPVIFLGITLANGRLAGKCSPITTLFSSRWWFAASAVVFLLAIHGGQTFLDYEHWQRGLRPFFWPNHLYTLIWPLILIALVTWLLPARSPRMVKSI